MPLGGLPWGNHSAQHTGKLKLSAREVTPEALLWRVGALMPVVPYGRLKGREPVQQTGWPGQSRVLQIGQQRG